VMAEAEDDETVGRVVDELCAVIADVARARADAD